VRLLSLLTHDIAPFSPLYDTLSLPDGSLTLTFLPAGSLTLQFWLNNCAVFVPFTCPFGSKTLTSYTRSLARRYGAVKQLRLCTVSAWLCSTAPPRTPAPSPGRTPGLGLGHRPPAQAVDVASAARQGPQLRPLPSRATAAVSRPAISPPIACPARQREGYPRELRLQRLCTLARSGPLPRHTVAPSWAGTLAQHGPLHSKHGCGSPGPRSPPRSWRATLPPAAGGALGTPRRRLPLPRPELAPPPSDGRRRDQPAPRRRGHVTSGPHAGDVEPAVEPAPRPTAARNARGLRQPHSALELEARTRPPRPQAAPTAPLMTLGDVHGYHAAMLLDIHFVSRHVR